MFELIDKKRVFNSILIKELIIILILGISRELLRLPYWREKPNQEEEAILQQSRCLEKKESFSCCIWLILILQEQFARTCQWLGSWWHSFLFWRFQRHWRWISILCRCTKRMIGNSSFWFFLEQIFWPFYYLKKEENLFILRF